MMTLIACVRPVARLVAAECAMYDNSPAAFCTLRRVASETYPRPLSARLAVAFETPARAATSAMVLMHPPRCGAECARTEHTAIAYSAAATNGTGSSRRVEGALPFP